MRLQRRSDRQIIDFPGRQQRKPLSLPAAGIEPAEFSKAEVLIGGKLKRADPRLIRDRTGFAIGGVSPIGHAAPIPAFAEEALLKHDAVWAAAGAHDAVFRAEPAKLLAAAEATVADIAE